MITIFPKTRSLFNFPALLVLIAGTFPFELSAEELPATHGAPDFQLNWGDELGWTDTSYYPWLYNEWHSWLYHAEGDPGESAWFFDPRLEGWWRSGKDYYPWVFHAGGGWREARRLYDRPPQPAAMPNVIFFFIDDFGYGDMGIYGNEIVETPNFDRLAMEGVMFTNAYVHPICSPSRVAATTGQWPDRWRIPTFLGTYEMNEDRGLADWLDPQAPSIARILQDHGFGTGHFGKWHMGGQRDVHTAPWIWEYGFHESITNNGGLGDRLLNEFDEYNGGGRSLPTDRRNARNLRGSIFWSPRSDGTAEYIDYAIDFIHRMRDAERPFYVNLWPNDTHLPHEPPLDRRGDRSPEAMLKGVIDEMDVHFGRLWRAIEDDPLLRDNTILIVASDNGAPPGGPGSNGILRGGKSNLWEGGTRVPFIVWAPGLMQGDREEFVDDKTIISAMDLPPSLLSILGIDVPEGVEFDGLDLSSALLGSPMERPEPLFWSGLTGASSEGLLAMRDGKWKLVYDLRDESVFLYDLHEDPSESNNLAEVQSEIAEDMTIRALAWLTEMEENAVELPLEGRPAQTPPLEPDPKYLFADTFSRSGAFGIDGLTGGIMGSVGESMAPNEVYWSSFSGGDNEIVDQALHTAVGAGMNELAIRHNFIDSRIVEAGGFSVGMEVVTIESVATGLSDRYTGFGVGLPQARAISSGNINSGNSFRGSADAPGAASCFVELNMDSHIQVWIAGELAASVPVYLAHGTLEAEFAMEGGFAQGETVRVSVFLNGKAVDLVPEVPGQNDLGFQWHHEAENFIGVSSRAGDRAVVDNLFVKER